ncbi:MAG: helix-turn-helix domain-containing protein [Bacteroidetes bacterium]|nr:helix-turn-helix domain-containing protein [Bacteroidota bacterium]
MTIALLAYEEAVLSSISGVMDMLGVANRCLADMGQEPFFNLEIISEQTTGNLPLTVPAEIICSLDVHQDSKADLILVPAFNAPPDLILERHDRLTNWLKKQYQSGVEIGSLCFGVYFLAEAGLLNGKDATAHWFAIPDLKLRYPQIKFLPDVLMTDKEGIYTSGGALLSWNLVLYLIEKFHSRELAVMVSKMFNIDLDKGRQSHFSIFQGQRSHGDERILIAQHFIEAHYSQPIPIEQVAAQAHMSKRNFIRKFKEATGNTPIEYIQRVKMEAAKKTLENTDSDMNQVMAEAGYNDLKSFRKVFRQVTGLNPQDYRRKFCRVGTARI